MRDYYKDYRFCKNCNTETPQECYDSKHERDGSYDSQECLICHWYRTGLSDKWYPPIKEE